jgi:transposase-like protein
MLIIKFWALSMSISKIEKLFKIDKQLKDLTGSDEEIDLDPKKIDRRNSARKNFICGLYQKLRNICSYVVRKDDLKLGGKGVIVEIDETLVAKVKYNVGKALKIRQVWLFGLIDRATNKCFLTIVPNRKKETLLKIIKEKCLDYTTIMSDKWSAYGSIPELNFKHLTVCHSKNFKNPITGACTNAIEGLWSQFKKRIKEMNGVSRSQLQSYIDEFMFRQNYCEGDNINTFLSMLHSIGKIYKPFQ